MGDIALADGDPIVAHTPIDDELTEHEEHRVPEQLLADAPAPIKYNATFQADLEKLKQEVYHEGLQVEEEGLTDIIRKKTKLPGVNAISQTTGQPPAAAAAAAAVAVASASNDASLVRRHNPRSQHSLNSRNPFRAPTSH